MIMNKMRNSLRIFFQAARNTNKLTKICFSSFLRELPSEGEAQAGGEPWASPCLTQDRCMRVPHNRTNVYVLAMIKNDIRWWDEQNKKFTHNIFPRRQEYKKMHKICFSCFLRELPSEGEAQAGGEPRASPCLTQDRCTRVSHNSTIVMYLL